MSFCCIRSWRENTNRNDEHEKQQGREVTVSSRGQTETPVPQLYLVEDVSLAAQVQVRQDAGRADGDGQTGLRDTGGNQSGLPLTKTRKQVGELGEPAWNHLSE